MANVLTLSSIKNKPSRNTFPLESHRLFTAKAGELLPVYWRLTYPDDNFELRHQHFIRTNPVNTAAFARFRTYLDWYYVPMRLINKNLSQALVNMQNNPVQASSILENKQITLDLPYAAWGYTLANNPGYALNTVFYYLCGRDPEVSRVRNFFGYSSAPLSYKLLRCLGYGNGYSEDSVISDGTALNYTSAQIFVDRFHAKESVNVNLLPLFAYQKIYCDYFRFEQWEKSEPFTYNCDYYSGGPFFASITTSAQWKTFCNNNNLLTLRYANWNKDMFMGIMPNTQLGSVAAINVSNSDGSLTPVVYKPNLSSYSTPVKASWTSPTQGNSQALDVTISQGTGASAFTAPGALYVSQSDITSFNILQLRMAQAQQKYSEICQANGQGYVEQIMAHWGYKLSTALSDHCIYVGGSSSNINISEVENTNLSGDSPSLLKGKGIGTGQSYEKFHAPEHGVLMAIMHIKPLIDYSITGHRPELLYTNTDDLPKPEFDKIGLESIPYISLLNYPVQFNPSVPTAQQSLLGPMGYLPRFYSAKCEVDTLFGAFETTKQAWTVTLNPQYLTSWFNNAIGVPGAGFGITYPFFKVNPSVCDTIFAVNADETVDTDQFDIDLFFDIKATRSFDYDGMPY